MRSASSSARMVTQRSTAARSEMGSKLLAASMDLGLSFTCGRALYESWGHGTVHMENQEKVVCSTDRSSVSGT